MVDPASIISTERRQALHSAPSSAPTKTRSEATISHSQPPELVADTSSGDESEEDEDEDEGPLTMAPAEMKVICRMSNRSNVLPVIAHADSLTDERLTAVKEAGKPFLTLSALSPELTMTPTLIVRKGLGDAGIDFGVFGPVDKDESKTQKRATRFANGSTSGHTENGEDSITVEGTDDEDAEGEDEDRQSRPVVKLRPSRHRKLSRSRSRRDLSSVAEDDRQPLVPDVTDLDSVANVRFSAHIFAKNDLNSLMPFALITPENKKRRRRQRPVSGQDSPATPTGASTVAHTVTSTEDSQESQATQDSALPPASPASAQSPSAAAKELFLLEPPADMKGVFVRKFRWGTVDVLDPKHCDFPALRTAILSTHLKVGVLFDDGGSNQRLT